MITGKSAPRQEPACLIASAARSRPNIDRRQESEPELVKPLVLSTPTAVVGNSLRPVFEPTRMSSKAEHTVCLHRSTPSSWARLGREREPGPSHPRGRARVCTSARARIVELTTDFTPVTGSCPRDPSARSGSYGLAARHVRSLPKRPNRRNRRPVCPVGRMATAGSSFSNCRRPSFSATGTSSHYDTVALVLAEAGRSTRCGGAILRSLPSQPTAVAQS
jgi:hypothetical protein